MATAPSLGVGTGILNTSRALDVTDFIFQIVPEDKPFFHAAGEAKAYDPVHQWQRRTFTTRTHSAANVGAVFNFQTQNRLPTREWNTTQIFLEEVRVSDTEKNSSHYAIDDLYADQMQVALAVMGTNMEHTLIRGSYLSAHTAQAPQMQGILMAIYSAMSTFTSFGRTDFTETQFNNTVNWLWDYGAEARDCFVGGRLKRRISSYTASSNQTRYIAADERRLIYSIGEYQTDFWPVYVHLSRDVYSGAALANTTDDVGVGQGMGGFNSALFSDLTMLKKAWLQPVLSERTARIAHSTDGVIHGELTLEWGHPHAHAWLCLVSG